jgi:hypothetical protein
MRYLRYLKTRFNICRKSNKPLIINENDINAINQSTINYNNQYPIDDIDLLENIIRLFIILVFNKYTERINGENYIPDTEQINLELIGILAYGEFIGQDFLLNNYQTLKELKNIDYHKEYQNSNEIFLNLITKMYNFENIDIINNIKIKY